MGNQSSQSTSLGEPIKNNIEVKWEKVTDIPFPLREGQCACSYGNNMYIFGGVIQNDGDLDNPTESNDLLAFNAGSLNNY